MTAIEYVESTELLTLSDRCDRCKAQAFAVAQFAFGELFFCGHHFREYREALHGTANTIIDETYRINERAEADAD